MNLIELFKKQDCKTIWGLLEKLKSDISVFSTRQQALIPLLEGKETYIYAQGQEMVIILIDQHRQGDSVLADEELFNDEAPLYYTEYTHWVSPVYLVQLASHAIREVLRKTGKNEPLIHGVLLTNTYIINHMDMQDIWDWCNITVIDDADLDNDIAVLDNFKTPEGELFQHYMTHMSSATWKLDPEHDHIVDKDVLVSFRKNRNDTDTEACSENYDDEIEVSLPDASSLRGVEVIKPLRHPRQKLNQLGWARQSEGKVACPYNVQSI